MNDDRGSKESVELAEAMDDLKSHREAWRGAIASHCTPFGSDDDGSYWDHELRAFDRTFDAFLAATPATPAGGESGEKLQATYNDLLALQDQTDHVPLATALDAVGLALSALATPTAMAQSNGDAETRKAGMEAAMEIVGSMRQAEAGMFDAKHSGQRGCDRADALYDVYVAIRAALTPSPEQGA